MDRINWYPGHMKKTRELIAAHLKLTDAVIEVCDARIPVSGRNPIIDELVAGKDRVLVLNKSDLADASANEAWVDHYKKSDVESRPRVVLALNSLSEQSARSLFKKLETMEVDMERRRARRAEDARAAGGLVAQSDGAPRKRRPLRVMVVGIPNSGKSSLINRLVGRKSAATGDRPGVTRGKQWLALANGMQLLDTPGILWPKFEDPQVGLHLAFCGSIRDEVMDIESLSLELIRTLLREYPDMLAARFRLDSPASAIVSDYEAEPYDPALRTMERIAAARGYILPRGRFDFARAASAILDEFRSGKIGRITLEHPEKR
ncbi:MAG: ribosome biogenesis GTPase YlqF [Clostridiales Family XIII bacterium]|jgi:ribosome biogenesis GTPase A|nr:ribosome biogenesis GTPase YlqF [Clostridiales Family XIII bacterium]